MRDVKSLQKCFKVNVAFWPLLGAVALVIFLSVTNIVGCSSAAGKGTKIPTYEQAKKEVLSRGPLVKPKVETQLSWLKGGKAAGVYKGEVVQIVDPKDSSKKPVTWGAVVLDAKKAAELKAIKDQRDLLLKKLEAAKLQRDANKIIHEAALQKMKEAAKRTWWEKNQGIVALTIGGALGAGLIIGILYALRR
jgi:hypothetical protein